MWSESSIILKVLLILLLIAELATCETNDNGPQFIQIGPHIGLQLVADDNSHIFIRSSKQDENPKEKIYVKYYPSYYYCEFDGFFKVTCYYIQDNNKEGTYGNEKEERFIELLVPEVDSYGIAILRGGYFVIDGLTFMGSMNIAAVKGIKMGKFSSTSSNLPYIFGLNLTLGVEDENEKEITVKDGASEFVCQTYDGDLNLEEYMTNDDYNKFSVTKGSPDLEDMDNKISIYWYNFHSLKINAYKSNLYLKNVSATWLSINGNDVCVSIPSARLGQADVTLKKENNKKEKGKARYNSIVFIDVKFQKHFDLNTDGRVNVLFDTVKAVEPSSLFDIKQTNKRDAILLYYKSITYYTNIDTMGYFNITLDSPSMEFNRLEYMGYTALFYEISSEGIFTCSGKLKCTFWTMRTKQFISGKAIGTLSAPMQLKMNIDKTDPKSRIEMLDHLHSCFMRFEKEEFVNSTMELNVNNIFLSSYDSVASMHRYILLNSTNDIWKMHYLGEESGEKDQFIRTVIYSYSNESSAKVSNSGPPNLSINKTFCKPPNEKGGKDDDTPTACYCTKPTEQDQDRKIKCKCDEEVTTWSTQFIILPKGDLNLNVTVNESESLLVETIGTTIDTMKIVNPKKADITALDARNQYIITDGTATNNSTTIDTPLNDGDNKQIVKSNNDEMQHLRSRDILTRDKIGMNTNVASNRCVIGLFGSNSNKFTLNADCQYNIYALYNIITGMNPHVNNPNKIEYNCYIDFKKDNNNNTECDLKPNNGVKYDNTTIDLNNGKLLLFKLLCATDSEYQINKGLNEGDYNTTAYEVKSSTTYILNNYTGNKGNITYCGDLTEIDDEVDIEGLESYKYLAGITDDITSVNFRRANIPAIDTTIFEKEREFDSFALADGTDFYVTELKAKTVNIDSAQVIILDYDSEKGDITANTNNLEVNVRPGENHFEGSYTIHGPIIHINDENNYQYVNRIKDNSTDYITGTIGNIDGKKSLNMTSISEFATLIININNQTITEIKDIYQITAPASIGVGAIIIAVLTVFWCLKSKSDANDVHLSSFDKETTKDDYTVSSAVSTSTK